MKRNSTEIFLESPGVITPLPWVVEVGVNRCDGNPDFSGFLDPALSVLRKAWQDFLNSGDDLIVEPDPEPVPDPVEPDWTGFNTALLSDAFWQDASAQLELTPTGRQILMSLAANSGGANAGAVQSSYFIALNYLGSQGYTLDPAAIPAWNGYATQFNIPVSFDLPT